MNFKQTYKISNKNKSIITTLADLPYWLMLYDEKINDICINESDQSDEFDKLWSNMYFCKYAVTKNGLCLKYIKNKTLELCKLAINQNGSSLEFVDKNIITYELCLLAVKQHRFAIKYVPRIFQSEELCMIAIKGKSKNGMFGIDIKNILSNFSNTDPEFIENGYVLQYIENQTTKICKYALECTPDSYVYVKHKTPELELHLNKSIKQIEKKSFYFDKMLQIINSF